MTSPSSLRDHLGYWMRILSNEVSASFARRLEAYGVSVAQWVVLRLLFDRENCTLVALCEALGMDKGGVSRMIDRLIKLGLVQRATSPRSRREVTLSLTGKARRLVPVLAREADRNDRHFFAVLSDSQRSVFLKTIRLLVAAHQAGEPKLALK